MGNCISVYGLAARHHSAYYVDTLTSLSSLSPRNKCVYLYKGETAWNGDWTTQGTDAIGCILNIFSAFKMSIKPVYMDALPSVL